jgi:hypothetical protein
LKQKKVNLIHPYTKSSASVLLFFALPQRREGTKGHKELMYFSSRKYKKIDGSHLRVPSDLGAFAAVLPMAYFPLFSLSYRLSVPLFLTSFPLLNALFSVHLSEWSNLIN